MSGNFYFAVFMVISGFGFVWGFFTVRGSGINNHVWAGREAPGSRLPDEFHQFAQRQLHDADLRRAARERDIGVVARQEQYAPRPAVAATAMTDDMTLDEANRALAAEAAARRHQQAQAEHTDALT